jgi:glycine hydroxymethyltransferase
MGCDEMCHIGGWILEVLLAPDDEELLRDIRGRVAELCRQFPVPGDKRGEG